MTEFISAKEYAEAQLNNIKKRISATKIQERWRIYIASIRCPEKNVISQAVINKSINAGGGHAGISWGKGSSSKINVSPDWRDNIEKTKGDCNKENGRSIRFTELININPFTDSQKNRETTERMEDKDGRNKDLTVFSSMVSNWKKCNASLKSSFFNNYMNGLNLEYSEENWSECLENLINELNDKEKVLMWSELGKVYFIHNFENDSIKSLSEHWKLYRLYQEIDALNREIYRTEGEPCVYGTRVYMKE